MALFLQDVLTTLHKVSLKFQEEKSANGFIIFSSEYFFFTST